MAALAAATVLALGIGAPAAADTPLPAPARTETQAGPSRVISDPQLGTTVIRTPGQPDWTVPGWHRFWALDPQGAFLLTVQPGGNLIGSNLPDTPAFEIHARGGCPPQEIRLRHLPGQGASLPQTSSHYLLYSGIAWDAVALAWRVTLGSGDKVLIYPQACEFPAQNG